MYCQEMANGMTLEAYEYGFFQFHDFSDNGTKIKVDLQISKMFQWNSKIVKIVDNNSL